VAVVDVCFGDGRNHLLVAVHKISADAMSMGST
jgi:hypothetical protein